MDISKGENEMDDPSKLVHAILLVLKGHKNGLCVNALLHAIIHIIKECALTKKDRADALDKIIKVLAAAVQEKKAGKNEAQ